MKLPRCLPWITPGKEAEEIGYTPRETVREWVDTLMPYTGRNLPFQSRLVSCLHLDKTHRPLPQGEQGGMYLFIGRYGSDREFIFWDGTQYRKSCWYRTGVEPGFYEEGL